MTRRKSCLKPDGSSETLQRKKADVFFGSVVVYEFISMLGDNPAVSEGAPLTIGWKHESKNVVDVDYYEFLRNQRPRRRRKDLILPSTARDTYLLGMGYRLDQIVSAAEETRRIRKSRISSMKGTPWDKFRAVFDRNGRKTPEPRIVVAKTG